jgi:fucose 4-O-acetylase-like acetyltransferase
MPAIISGTITLKYAITPWWILWYLLSLIFWKSLVFYISPKISKNTFVIISFIICLLVGFIPFIGYTLSLSRTFVFFPFFLLGFYTDKNHIAKFRSLPKYFSYLFLALILISLFFLKTGLHSIVSGAFSYYYINNIYIGLCARLLFVIISILMSIAFINIVPNISLFSFIGKDTLLYYSYHGYLIKIFTVLISKFDILTNFIVLLLFSFLTLLIIYIFSQFKISRIILNPYSILYNKYIH